MHFCFILTLFFAFFSALTTDTSAESLKVKMFLLDEKMACVPDGYAAPCQKKWQAGDVQDKFEKALVKTSGIVPPEKKITLGALRHTINDRALCFLRKKRCPRPKTPKALMLLLEWGAPQTGKITIKRFSKDGTMTYKSETKNMNNELRFVNHQQAIYFYPGSQNSWKVTLDGTTWLFETKS